MEVSLAVSLNATTDEVRSRLMPINRTYPIARLMQALHYYCDKTGNTVTIEYVLFKGVNDSDDDAHRLMGLLKGLPCMINLLMFNPFQETPFERPDEERVYAFRNILLNHGFVAVVRNNRGKDISAACVAQGSFSPHRPRTRFVDTRGTRGNCPNLPGSSTGPRALRHLISSPNPYGVQSSPV